MFLFILLSTALAANTWVYKKEVSDGTDLTPETFSLEQTQLREFGESSVHLRLVYTSLDACLREAFTKNPKFGFLGMFGIAFEVGQPLKSFVSLWRVVKSNNSKVQQRELYLRNTPAEIASDTIVDSMEHFTKVPELEDNRMYVGLLGNSAWTAMGSLNVITKPKTGEVHYVSAAAGALGTIVVQLMKTKNVTVIGSAGSEEKVTFLKEIGCDHAFNYKAKNVADALAEFAPEGLDGYYDNVGGSTLEAAIDAMKPLGRITVSGMISQYGKPKEKQYGVRNLVQIVNKQLTMKGFLLGMTPGMEGSNFPAWNEKMLKLLTEGKMKFPVSEFSWEDYGVGFAGMYKGKNTGKVVISGPKGNVCEEEN